MVCAFDFRPNISGHLNFGRTMTLAKTVPMATITATPSGTTFMLISMLFHDRQSSVVVAIVPCRLWMHTADIEYNTAGIECNFRNSCRRHLTALLKILGLRNYYEILNL